MSGRGANEERDKGRQARRKARRQEGRQAGRQAGRQTGGRTYTQDTKTDRETVRQTDRETERQTDGQADELTSQLEPQHVHHDALARQQEVLGGRPPSRGGKAAGSLLLSGAEHEGADAVGIPEAHDPYPVDHHLRKGRSEG